MLQLIYCILQSWYIISCLPLSLSLSLSLYIYIYIYNSYVSDISNISPLDFMCVNLVLHCQCEQLTARTLCLWQIEHSIKLNVNGVNHITCVILSIFHAFQPPSSPTLLTLKTKEHNTYRLTKFARCRGNKKSCINIYIYIYIYNLQKMAESNQSYLMLTKSLK